MSEAAEQQQATVVADADNVGGSASAPAAGGAGGDAACGLQSLQSMLSLSALADALDDTGLQYPNIPDLSPASVLPEAAAPEPGTQGAALEAAGVLPPVRKAHTRDKLAFLLGTTALWACAFWLGQRPESFYYLYTALGLVLFSARWAVYKRKKWHYYLLDLCYACNLLLLLHLWSFPGSRLLAQTTFAFNTGPLTMSIMAFRNSLVFHDMDKVTSLFLHLVPACVSWANKWYPDTHRFPPDMYSGSGSVTDLVAIPLLFYVGWAAFYVFVVFILAKERIRKRGYITLFTYVTTRKAGIYAAIARRVPTPIQPLVYLICHMAFCACTLFMSVLAWRSFIAHNALLVLAITLSLLNGGTYYFEVFAKKHKVESTTQLTGSDNKSGKTE